MSFLIAITVHEFMHAWTALRLGDDTAEREGRVTLNPVAHFDPIGFLFGLLRSSASRPSPGASRCRSTCTGCAGGRQGMAIVAVAGPLSNVVLAAVAAFSLPAPRKRGAGSSCKRSDRS